MKAALLLRLLALLFLATTWYAASAGSVDNATPNSWNQAAAAQYLDSREIWWQGWDASQRDHKTVCVSCHTVLPYALSRSSLRGALGEEAPSAPEHVMLNNVLRRVTLWNQVQPFYSNSQEGPTLAPDSRATESVINALILSTYDAQKNHLTDITRSAFDEAWALQIKSGEQAGAWDWHNFHLAPWESNESQYYGAALAAVAVGRAPDDYRDDPKIQENLRLLRGYLRREYAAQPLINKVYLLWASAKLPGLLTSSERSRAGGDDTFQAATGWRLEPDRPGHLATRDKTPLETRSDGSLPASLWWRWSKPGLARNLPQAKRGLAWLAQNQSPDEGKWPAWSVNLKRDPTRISGVS